MTIRLHASTRNDMSGTPFQIYLLDIETGLEASVLLRQDFKGIEEVRGSLLNVAYDLYDAAKRAGIK